MGATNNANQELNSKNCEVCKNLECEYRNSFLKLLFYTFRQNKT